MIFYDQVQYYLKEEEVTTSDTVLLVCGGHDFFVLEPTEMIEVKQGPYAGENDKTLFGD